MAERQTVRFSGENPGMTLYKPGTDQVIALASYWKCVFSEEGTGNALLIWVDGEATGLGDAAPFGIYADNPHVGKMVAREFTQYFGEYKGRGFESIEPVNARFTQDYHRYYHRVMAHRDDHHTIELMWFGMIEQQLRQVSPYELGPNTWDLATVICPCHQGHMRIDEHLVEGETRVKDDESGVSSSAFLAFSETWRTHQG